MSSFHDRQKSLFNQLKSAEEQHSFCKTNKLSEQPDYGTIDKQIYKKVKREMKQFRGKESIFKRENANLSQCLSSRSKPGYMKNPQKWQYYSLSDVTTEQMSDKTNTETALAFIRELEDRAMRQVQTDKIVDETGAVFKKPTFNISKTIKKISEEKEEGPIFKNNKIIMPEYVVGISRNKINKNENKLTKLKNTGDIKKAELKLNHLYENDDDDVDELMD